MTHSAQAAVARIPGGGFSIEAITLDEPRAGEVLVRIAGVGICHTDLVFAERLGIMKAPAVLGHEGAGVVERVGEGVTKVAPGDTVVLTFNSCGGCARCQSHEPAYCQSFPKFNYGAGRLDGSSAIHVDGERASSNFFGQSSFATLAIAHQRNVVRIHTRLPLGLMGPLGCGVQTGAGAIMRSLACRQGSSLLVLGGGAVGLSAVLGAVVQGCSRTIVVEPQAARRQLALELGATDAIDPNTGDLAGQIRALLPAGVDYAFDSSGLTSVIQAALGCLGSHASFGFVGVPPGIEDALSIQLNTLIGSGIKLIGIIEGDSDPDVFIPQMVQLQQDGRFPFERLITTYPLAEINQAIQDQADGLCVKAVLLTHQP